MLRVPSLAKAMYVFLTPIVVSYYDDKKISTALTENRGAHHFPDRESLESVSSSSPMVAD